MLKNAPAPPKSRAARQRALRGQAYIVAAAVLWSFGGLFIKTLMAEPYCVRPYALACLRSLFAGLALAWALPGLRGAPLGRVASATVAYATLILTYVWANFLTTAANAILLQFFYPLIVAVGAVAIYRERLHAKTVAALAIAMAGVTVIAAGSWRPGEWLGVGLGLSSAVAFGVFLLIQRSIRTGNAVGLASLYNLLTAAALLPLALEELSLPPAAYAIIAVQGVVQIGIPYVLFFKGLRLTSAITAAVISLGEAALNPVWVWLGVGEVPTTWTIVGGLAIVAALLIQFLAKADEDNTQPATGREIR